jgi:signal transduction histidine kinase/CheY-like chemotaxis protein
VSSAIEPTHPEWLQGGGEMGALIRSRDWSKTPLGPLASWPATLRTMVRLALDSGRPAAIAWGPAAIHLYNDAYRRLGAGGHPGALGEPFGACAEPALVALAAPLRAALAGAPQLLERQRLLIDRGASRGEALFTVSFDPIRDGTGEVAGAFVVVQEAAREAPGEDEWVGSNTDVTERRRAQEAQLGIQKMEALGTLAGGIAHDFNNILAAIEGNAKLAIADLPVDHPAQESLSEIEKSTARAVDVVRRILTFSRHQEPNRDVIDLRPAIEEALGLLRATLPAGVELRAEFASDVAHTIADPTEVHQIVMNLITNASHAIGSRGGRIDLRVDTALVASTEDDAIAGLRPGRYARLTVTDDGNGMDKQTSDRIFDPFFTTKPVGQGTGLGLSLVHGVMKSTGGMVTVDSQLGVGTTFRLYFPAAEGAPKAAKATPPDDVRPHRGRILYVDDEGALVKLITRGLRRMGYVVTGFTEPALALEWARAQPNAFDVAVTDLSMPGMSGFDLVRALLALRPTLPVVMITGYARAEDYAAAAEAGVSALILKPSTVEQLASELRRFVMERIDLKKGAPPA